MTNTQINTTLIAVFLALSATTIFGKEKVQETEITAFDVALRDARHCLKLTNVDCSEQLELVNQMLKHDESKSNTPSFRQYDPVIDGMKMNLP